MNFDMGTGLLIRPFAARDQEVARLLVLRGLGEHFGYIDESLNPDVDDIAAYYVLAGHDFVVAVKGGFLVGTAALVRETSWTGRLVRMSVDSAYRRQGIGKALVGHLVELARQRDLHQVLVETNHDWPGVINFYQSQGFMEYDRDAESIYMCLRLP
jgi:ribosomal protein S18 acetylase RimI-like enzyme